MEVNMKSYYKHVTAILTLMMVILSLLGCITVRAEFLKKERNDRSITNEQDPTITFTLQTETEDGCFYYRDVGGEIDGVINPDRNVLPGTTIRVILLIGDNLPHAIYSPNSYAKSDQWMHEGDHIELTFHINENISGKYAYYCTIPGHRQLGQEGLLIIDPH